MVEHQAAADSRPAISGRRGLHGRVVDRLGRRIVAGEIAPGDVLDLDAIVEEFGGSRTAVREALKVLTTKGLLDARPRRGTVVRERAAWQLLDADVLSWWPEDDRLDRAVEDLRAIVEPAAARRAAALRAPEGVDALSRALARLEKTVGGRTDRIAAAHVDFHNALLTASGNALLAQLGSVLPTVLARGSAVHLPLHREVVIAIAEGDPDAASAAVERLLQHPTEAGMRANTEPV